MKVCCALFCFNLFLKTASSAYGLVKDTRTCKFFINRNGNKLNCFYHQLLELSVAALKFPLVLLLSVISSVSCVLSPSLRAWEERHLMANDIGMCHIPEGEANRLKDERLRIRPSGVVVQAQLQGKPICVQE